MRDKIFIISILLPIAFCIIFIGVFIYLINTNSQFDTKFKEVTGYTAYGHDYAKEIAESEGYKEYFYTYRPLYGEYDKEDCQHPFVITFYLEDETSITYVAWYDDNNVDNVDWEVIDQ